MAQSCSTRGVHTRASPPLCPCCSNALELLAMGTLHGYQAGPGAGAATKRGVYRRGSGDGGCVIT